MRSSPCMTIKFGIWLTMYQDLRQLGSHGSSRKKTDMDGKVHTFKARLVARGFTQMTWVNYDETLSPVTKMKSIRVMLAIVAFHDYEIWQMDVEATFLNWKMVEDVYMSKSKGFVDRKYLNRVCKLEKSIYGLKQSSCIWNPCFDEKVKEFGFCRSEDESCVYVKASESILTVTPQNQERRKHSGVEDVM